MVDVGEKDTTQRMAVAEGFIRMQPQTLELVQTGAHKKGDVLAVARIAAIMAAKKTADVIPLCHPLALTAVDVTFEINVNSRDVRCQASVKTSGKTGVEMEALTAVNVALLTIYDMCKAVDRGMSMHDIQLLHKSGGKSGVWNRAE